MEEPSSSSAAHVIRVTRAATELLDPHRRRFLEPFMRAERSASEVARELGVPVKDVAYRVQRFVALGLLACTREQPRGGRPIRFYRAAVSFFVPFAVLPEPDVVEIVEALAQPWHTLSVRGAVRAMLSAEEGLRDWGWLLRVRDRGVSISPAPGPDSSQEAQQRLLLGRAVPMYLGWVPFHLSRERARELQQALVDLVLRFRDDDGPEPYLLGMALAPLEKGGGTEPGER